MICAARSLWWWWWSSSSSGKGMPTGARIFHAVVELEGKMRVCAAEAALEERHALPSHCLRGRSQLWPALRYMHSASPKKPVVDAHTFVWREDKRIDLKQLWRGPFVAEAWRKRRDAAEFRAVIEETMRAELVNAKFMLSHVARNRLLVRTSRKQQWRSQRARSGARSAAPHTKQNGEHSLLPWFRLTCGVCARTSAGHARSRRR
jgi:hypothetical protein